MSLRIEATLGLVKSNKIHSAAKTESVANRDGNLYAVLFNADVGRHSKDLRLIRSSLINNSVRPELITVLEGAGDTDDNFLTLTASVRNLDAVISNIRKVITPDDRALIYVTNHGFFKDDTCYVNTYYSYFSETTFEQITDEIPANFIVFYFAQCYAGGFVERLGKGKNIAISACSKGEKSWGRTSRGIGTYFTHLLFPLILRRGMSIEKAFDKAVFADTFWLLKKLGKITHRETPQLGWQNADPSKLYLGSPRRTRKA